VYCACQLTVEFSAVEVISNAFSCTICNAVAVAGGVNVNEVDGIADAPGTPDGYWDSYSL
jgi:hypothetical protein